MLCLIMILEAGLWSEQDVSRVDLLERTYHPPMGGLYQFRSFTPLVYKFKNRHDCRTITHIAATCTTYQ